MEWLGALDAQGWEFARQALQRGIAAVFAVAFLSTVLQFPALLGEHGLLPVPDFLRRAYARRQPTLFRWHYSDGMLRAVCVAGILVSLALVAGIPQLGPPWVPMVCFLALWFGYLSITNVGQTFYGFGWEMLLVEAGFVAAFLGSNRTAPPVLVLWFFWWLIIRLEVGAGLIKLRGGREWRDLTALMYHHETQPMPNPLSRRAHLLPAWFHRVEVVGNHVAQFGAPLVLLLPQPVGAVGAGLIILTQLWLVLTGNFAWLNWITIVLAFAGISDAVARAVLPVIPPTPDYEPTPLWWSVTVIVVVAGLVVLSWPPLKNLFSRRQLMNASFNRFHLVNAYGAFGTVTRAREEIVVEGTTDGRSWTEYEFRGKPGDVHRIPGWFAPYHLRLDWLMWFLALGSRSEDWFFAFLVRLLEADRPTLRLLAHDPFAGDPPLAVRARRYRYRFARREERGPDSAVWVREDRGMLVPAITLRGPEDADVAGDPGDAGGPGAGARDAGDGS